MSGDVKKFVMFSVFVGVGSLVHVGRCQEVRDVLGFCWRGKEAFSFLSGKGKKGFNLTFIFSSNWVMSQGVSSIPMI